MELHNNAPRRVIGVQMGIYEEEQRKAKERQRNGAAQKGKAEGSAGKSGTSEASEATAKRVGGTTKDMVKKAAWLEEHAPEELEEVRKGRVLVAAPPSRL